MTFTFEQPPDELAGYHLPYLLAAEAGTLTYDTNRYQIHAVPNNARALELCGLLAYGPDGMALTELGRHMLANWKASPKGQAYLAERNNPTTEDHGPQEPQPKTSQSEPARANQLDLFAATA